MFLQNIAHRIHEFKIPERILISHPADTSRIRKRYVIAYFVNISLGILVYCIFIE